MANFFDKVKSMINVSEDEYYDDYYDVEENPDDVKNQDDYDSYHPKDVEEKDVEKEDPKDLADAANNPKDVDANADDVNEEKKEEEETESDKEEKEKQRRLKMIRGKEKNEFSSYLKKKKPAVFKEYRKKMFKWIIYDFFIIILHLKRTFDKNINSKLKLRLEEKLIIIPFQIFLFFL